MMHLLTNLRFKSVIALLAPLSLSLLLACGAVGRKKSEQVNPPKPGAFESYQAYEHFVQGDLYEQAGNLDGAAQEYSKALIFDPTSAEIKRSLSSVYLNQRKFEEAAVLRSEIQDKSADDYAFIGDCMRFSNDLNAAASFYERAVEMDSTLFGPRMYLVRIYQLNGDNDKAIDQFRYLAKHAPDRIGVMMDMASLYLKMNKFDKALETYSGAATLDSTDARPVIGLATVYMAQGDTTRSDSLFSSLTQRNWNDPNMLNSLAATFLAIRDLDWAEKIAARIVQLAPDDIEAQKRYGMILYRNRKYAQAESLMVDLDQKGYGDAVIYYYLGRINQDSQKWPQAEDYFRKSLAQADTLIDSWVNLALVVNGEGKYQDALDVMRRAMQTVPQDSNSILFYTSVIHGRNNHFELARDGYLRLMASLPNDTEIRFNLGAAYERLGQFDDAVKEFKQILDKEPDNALTLNYLGYMYADKGVHLNEAREMIEKALKVDPNNGAYLDSYAWVLFRMGKYDDALVQMKKALASEEKDPILLDHAGDIYSALKDTDLARQSWQKALELDPNNEAIRQKLNTK